LDQTLHISSTRHNAVLPSLSTRRSPDLTLVKQCTRAHRNQRSFPTRRSSDLIRCRRRRNGTVSEHRAIGRIEETAALPGAGGPGSDFTAGEALMQPALNRITVHGQVHQVEPKVMQVLLLMAARPGHVVGREAFLETVWAGTVGDDYLLNRAVSELRRIFGDDPRTPRYIETIRKGGYRLVAPIAPARVAAAVPAPGVGSPPPAAVSPAQAEPVGAAATPPP